MGPAWAAGPRRSPAKEYLAYLKGRGGRQNITLLVQIPASFDPARACIVTGPSSGSRGIYGAIATSGEWGLKKGCAVAYTDKGTGAGAHDLESDLVSLIDGRRARCRCRGRASNFTARLSDAAAPGFTDQSRIAGPGSTPTPSSTRSATGASTSSVGRARASGRSTSSIRAAPGQPRLRFGLANTLVIASSVSNGGGATLRAAEQAPKGMIDGIVVSEPNVNPCTKALRHPAGRRRRWPRTAGLLIDYTTLMNLFQGCANAGLR